MVNDCIGLVPNPIVPVPSLNFPPVPLSGDKGGMHNPFYRLYLNFFKAGLAALDILNSQDNLYKYSPAAVQPSNNKSFKLNKDIKPANLSISLDNFPVFVCKQPHTINTCVANHSAIPGMRMPTDFHTEYWNSKKPRLELLRFRGSGGLDLKLAFNGYGISSVYYLTTINIGRVKFLRRGNGYTELKIKDQGQTLSIRYGMGSSRIININFRYFKINRRNKKDWHSNSYKVNTRSPKRMNPIENRLAGALDFLKLCSGSLERAAFFRPGSFFHVFQILRNPS